MPADVGKGVFLEATLIYNYVYDEKGNRRCIPVLISGAQEDAIPQVLRGWNRYHLTTLRFTLSHKLRRSPEERRLALPVSVRTTPSESCVLPSFGIFDQNPCRHSNR